jgi:uncharacterized Zn-binding protein involved in type VI secretion
MPEAARGSGKDSVNTNHGCDATTVTDVCSGNVFANSFGIVRFDDAVKSHLVPAGDDCVSHAPAMDTNCSGSVYVNSKKAAFLGSMYGGSEDVSSGSPNVFIGAK